MALLTVALSQRLAVSWAVVPGLLATGAGTLGLSLALFYLARQRIGAGRSGLIATTSGMGSAVLLLHELLTLKVIGGGLLMFVGLGAFAWETARKGPEGHGASSGPAREEQAGR